VAVLSEANGWARQGEAAVERREEKGADDGGRTLLRRPGRRKSLGGSGPDGHL
jgi:hypothetical protein